MNQFDQFFDLSGLSLDRLRSFLEVAEAGNLNQAAQEDQTKQIKELEEFFGVALTRRVGQRIEITEDGRKLAMIIRFKFSEQETFREAMAGQHRATKMACLVVLPTYNERENLSVLVRRLLEQMPMAHILVTDDASPDGTGELADVMAASDSRIHVLHRSSKQGLGRAYIDGFRWGLSAGYEILVQMDADLSHDPAAVLELVNALDRADLAIGSRYAPGGSVVDWGWSRRVLSRFGGIYARSWLGLPVRDPTGGFKAWKARLLERILFEGVEGVEAVGYAFQVETTYRAIKAGAIVLEVPIVFRERVWGASKMSWDQVKEAMVAVPKLRWKDFDCQGVPT